MAATAAVQATSRRAVPGARAIGAVLGVLGALMRGAEATAGPILDLIIRLWLAQIFFVSGLLKVADWDVAMALASQEYPVTWMAPGLAAVVGAGIEVIGAVLLAFGLATRLAALPMLVLSLVIQIEYLALPTHIYWALLFGWIVVRGPGPLSIDGLLGRGFAETAFPLAASLSNLFRAVTRYAGPVYDVVIRVWVAQIFFLSGLTKIDDMGTTLVLFRDIYQVPLLPPAFLAYAATVFEIVCPILLAVGLLTRLAVLPLIAMTLVINFAVLYHGDHYYWLMLLGLILVHGPGPLSLDTLCGRIVARSFPQFTGQPERPLVDLPHVVIVGAGFGGISAAKALAGAPVRVTLIDRHNYHLFQPLLYQVATAGLSPADIAVPIRSVFRDQTNIAVLLGRVTGVDTDDRCVRLEDGRRLPYDYLVLATGARHGYFGKDAEWSDLAPGLKKIEDATEIRRRLLVAFERAENTDDEMERQRLLTFVIVGGGPTGVELAGAIAELARHGMRGEFRRIDPASARVILVQGAPRLLPPFPERLSAMTQRSLADLGVEVRVAARVGEIDTLGVRIGDERIAAATVFWAAGVIASPAAKWLQAEHDRAGRIVVGPDLSVPGHDGVFAIGDTALSQAWKGQPVPGLAPAAKQGGTYVARAIRARVRGRRQPKPFAYSHMGSLATIGRKSAVADFGTVKLSGALAWWLWGVIHVFFLVGMRNRLSVMVNWFWAYLTFRSGTRLITHGNETPATARPAAETA